MALRSRSCVMIAGLLVLAGLTVRPSSTPATITAQSLTTEGIEYNCTSVPEPDEVVSVETKKTKKKKKTISRPPSFDDVVVDSQLKVRQVVREALRMRDPKANITGLVGDDSRPVNVSWPTEWETFYYANRVRESELRLVPAFQAYPGKLAKFAIVTAWNWDNTHRRSNETGAAAVFLKTLYCRRRGCDLYVEDTIQLLREVNVTATHLNLVKFRLMPSVRHHQWAKPVIVAKYLPFYEWVAWQDNDIFPMDFDFAMNDLTKEGAPYHGADLIAGWEASLVPLNTGHYYMRRSKRALSFLKSAWPTTDVFLNDQGAFAATLKRFAAKLTYVAVPVSTLGAWLHTSHHTDWKQYNYTQPFAHLSFCETADCGVPTAHLTTVSLNLNGIRGEVPSALLFSTPRPTPTVTSNNSGSPRLAVVVSPSRRRNDTHSQRIQQRWIQYCQRHGYAFEDAPLQGLWVASRMPRARHDERWRVVQEVLPYYDWVLYVEPDVVMADFDKPLLETLVARGDDTTDWIAPRNGKEFAFLIRRTRRTLCQVHNFYSRTEFAPSIALTEPSPWALTRAAGARALVAGVPTAVCPDCCWAVQQGEASAFVLVKLPVPWCFSDATNETLISCSAFLE